MSGVMKKLVRKATNKISTRKLAREFGISQAYVRKILRRAGVVYIKRKQVPDLTAKQLKTQKKRLRKLARNLMQATSMCQIVMDDESYVTYSGDNVTENQGFYTSGPIQEVPEDVGLRTKSKFPKKIMVRLSISQKVISEPFFCQSGGALNSETYRKGCVTKRLVPFIDEKHTGDEALFWPDLASCHYARETQDLLQAKGIPFVPKDDSPPCYPQLRPIEDVWSIIKARTYAGG